MIAASILGQEWGSSSSTDESSPVGNKSDFSDVFDCKNPAVSQKRYQV